MSDHIAEINKTTQEQARGSRLLAEEADRVRDIALQVKNSTDEQSVAGSGISEAMEQIAADVRSIWRVKIRAVFCAGRAGPR